MNHTQRELCLTVHNAIQYSVHTNNTHSHTISIVNACWKQHTLGATEHTIVFRHAMRIIAKGIQPVYIGTSIRTVPNFSLYTPLSAGFTKMFKALQRLFISSSIFQNASAELHFTQIKITQTRQKCITHIYTSTTLRHSNEFYSYR
jgi:hypothetical protein